ncbi:MULTISPECIES: hybrid sensor histidine kinase/response regulator transcription factor [unclassified Cellulophaga]|uniref:hybrid sensor histidine kinase/response regulator transcription factor n=1 Tax=unclassified Cellulophaga TaxID=2634405 RepID=UPI000C2BC19A|nr:MULTISPECIES: substrate-binding domain-containing protein [unclassified Cellulophaga]MDO6492231.1 substrate-binding domain-containing protein [Cellulophaga sp. 2_MG-2023]MDO6493181.1 substrate-binding domain-containing protein [Cellulophaga sp. 3_MG-2023]PKB44829.1 monosaccharide ABC transporter substrate-binding protein (CUT2 family) [Cellulophaga sp. RHA19]
MLRFNFSKLAVIFALIICYGCNNSKEDAKKLTIGFSQTGVNDQWRKSMNESMQIQSDFNSDIDLKILDGKDNVEKQIEDIKQFIKEKVDVLIISPIKSKPITPFVNKAIEQGIPVLIVDRKIDGQNYTSYIGGDNIQIGKNAANYIASLNKNDDKKILEITGLKGSSPAKERHLGFKYVISAITNLSITHTIEGNWEANSIKEPLNTYLDKNKDIDYIFCHNDRMALGAWEILVDKKLDKKIDVIGVDGLTGANGGIQLVKDKILKATIYYPTGGDEAIKTAIKIINGEKVAKKNILETIVIDSRNADIMSNQFDKIIQHQKDILKQQEKIKLQEETYTNQSNVLKIVFGLFILSIVLGIFSIYSGYNIKKKKQELEASNIEIKKQRNKIKKIATEAELSNEAKVNFFTGLSHEFKTPITLILSSIESLSDNKTIRDNNLTKDIRLIFNNSKRLLRLINQLLDFRKAEEHQFKLKASKVNLLEFSETIYEDFKYEAQKKDIKFTLETNNKDLEIYIDKNLIDKVYFNLLSNAFKFTPENGEITIKIEDHKNKDFINIYFKDTGIGIPRDDLDKVFKAFFRGTNNNKSSSGIGLLLSKEFIELHKGSIAVSSKLGTEFTIKLHKGSSHLSEDEIICETDVLETSVINFFNEDEDNVFNESSIADSQDNYVILIIEDNLDLIKFLKSKLSLNYEVHLSNGIDAIEKALDIIPDIIICDVNLPDKDGFTICEVLKNDLRTSHIPTIILTALESKDSYIKGLESGADLYLTKPFSFSVLSQSIKTTIYNREKLRYYFINNIHKINSQENFGSTEQDFIIQINNLIEDNIDNSNFSVETMAENLNISRVQLYRKLKAILGVNVSDYILNTRLDKAKKLLKESSLSISEIAYATGFSSPNYFSTSFKSKFDTSPKQYRDT